MRNQSFCAARSAVQWRKLQKEWAYRGRKMDEGGEMAILVLLRAHETVSYPTDGGIDSFILT